MAQSIVGVDGRLYYKVGGLSSVNPFVEATRVKNATATCTLGTADVSHRGSGGWRVAADAFNPFCEKRKQETKVRIRDLKHFFVRE